MATIRERNQRSHPKIVGVSWSRPRRRARPLHALALALLLAGGPVLLPQARAADGQDGFAATPPPPGARVYFIDLKDGARVPLKLLVRFGLANMGVAPAGSVVPATAHQHASNTGHHHIIIDAPLPRPDRPIPADDNHVHLGGGQTEAEITLTPGPHTLQLLVGDRNHVPNDPPVASPPITVVAVEPRISAPEGAAVSFIGMQDGATVPGPVRLYFGVKGMGVAPARSEVPKTGHFHVVIDADTPDPDLPIPKDDRHRSFPDGATQTDLNLEPGLHTLQLVFTSFNGRSFDPPLVSKRVSIRVRRRR
ncbi:DUF4399 domain-containing protein [Methylobacterium variabile]|jgi:hypothetical protein|uniref:DUF4399 domain-containing protein n=1 Tax=Methylobacterium variabile TaxID=298794 RepID=UPI0009FAF655|nr:DUF4399 domain-containing protein [Methylobacterium variabile]